MRTEDVQCAAVDATVALLGDKWTLLVLGVLAKSGTLRYSEIERGVTGISQRMLTLTLRRLEENGLVKRTTFATVPPRVDYELTPLGRALREPLKTLLDWIVENRAAMAEARGAFAKRD